MCRLGEPVVCYGDTVLPVSFGYSATALVSAFI